MTKLDSNEIIKELEELHRYDLVGEYDLYMDRQAFGDYFKVDDIVDLIKKLIYEIDY